MKNIEIINCLNANKDVSGFELHVRKKDTRELYCVLKHLEISRAIKTENKTATVYVNTDDKTGSSSIMITAADDELSLNKKVAEAVKKAKSALNQYYPLIKDENISVEDDKDYDLNSIAGKVAEAVFRADVYDKGWINSTEIYVTRTNDSFINSNEVNHNSNNFRISIEVIPTWSGEKEEYELYKFYVSGQLDYERITAEVDKILLAAKNRSEALIFEEAQLDKNVKVLVSGEMVEKLVNGLSKEFNYQSQFYKQAHYKKGDVLSDTPFDMVMTNHIEGSSLNCLYDYHGKVLNKKTVVEKGVVKDYYGDIRFGYYLKEDISGDLPLVEVRAEGSEYKDDNYLIIDNFSSPQLELSSGYFGGEVRLGRYFKDGKCIPVTGFSISGNILKDIKDIEFSKEQTTSEKYSGPKYFIFKNISIH